MNNHFPNQCWKVVPRFFLLSACMLFLSMGQIGYGQAPYQFHSFGFEDGLLSSQVYCAEEDPEGYMWFGTENGLYRFDGHSFQLFQAEPGNPNSLKGNSIRSLFLDGQARLWISTNRGLNYLDTRSRKFHPVEIRLDRSGSTINPIYTIAEDQNKNIWFGADGLKLLKWKPDAKPDEANVQVYSIDSPERYSSRGIREIIPTGLGYLWAKAPGGIILFNVETGTGSFDPEPSIATRSDYKNLKESLFSSIPLDGLQHVSFYRQPYPYTAISRQLPIEVFEKVHELQQQAKGAFEESIRHDGWIYHFDGTPLFWVNVNPDLLFEVDTISKKVQRIEFPGKGGEKVTFLFKDSQGNIWSSIYGQLFLLPSYRSPFKHFAHQEEDPGSLSNNHVRAIQEDDEGHLWVANLAKGVDQMIYHPDNGWQKARQFSHEPDNPQSLPFNGVTNIFKDRTGRLWFSTFEGLGSYQPQTGKWNNYYHNPNDPNSLSADRVWGLEEDDEGNIWVGSFRQGINRLDPKNGQITRFLHDPDNPNSLSNNNSKALLYTPDRKLWIGTNNGLNRLDLETGTFTHYFHDPGNPNSLSSSYVWSLCLDKENRLWVGTSIGLNRYDPDTDHFERIYQNDGLPSNLIFNLFPGDQNDLWINTDRGLVNLSLPSTPSDLNLVDAVTIKVYDEKRGLGGNSFLPNASGVSNRYSQFFFGGLHGLTMVDSKILSQPKVEPRLVFSSMSLIDPKTGKTVTDPFVGNKDLVVLSHLTARVSFGISDLIFLKFNDFNYEYQLEGASTQWIPAENNQTITLTNLNPGNYTLKVRRQKAETKETGTSIQMRISVLPPWWKSTWAYLGYLLALAGALYLGYRFQLRRQLQKQETENLKALNAFKDQIYTNITHEFRTPLTVISGLIEKVDGHDRVKDIIRRNSASLINLVNQILDLRRMELGKLELNYTQGDLVLYLRSILESYQMLAEQQGITITFDSKEKSLFMDFDREKLLRILSNLLSNAIKFTPAGGSIHLSVDLDNTKGSSIKSPEMVRIQLTDTGVGIPASEQPFVFDRFYQVKSRPSKPGPARIFKKQKKELHYRGPGAGTGIGLALTRDLVHLMDGSIELDSQVGKGSSFTIFLPIHRRASLEQAREVELPDTALLTTGTVYEGHATALDADPNNLEKPSVLIIEDHPDIQEYLRSLLNQQYILYLAGDGQEGVDMALEKIPDLIISDVMMPGKDGFEVCDTLKKDERTSHIPIVLLTAKASVESRVTGLRMGADAYLAKPFHPTELFVRLEKLAELRAKLQEKYRALPAPHGQTESEPTLEDIFLQKIRSYVQDHLSEPELSVPNLCQSLFLSYSQFYRKVKALTGLTPSLLIRSIRLQAAHELLKSTDLNVTEIAYETGFSSTSYFSKAFLEEFEARPTDIRK